MRYPFSFTLATCFLAWGIPAVAADSHVALADRIFGNADKNNDNSLDEKEMNEARRIFKAAIFEKKKADELPGGKASFEKIENAAVKGKLDDNKNGVVTKDEWRDHVKDAFKKKDAILKDARERHAAAVAAAAKKQSDQAKLDKLRREKEQLEKKLKQKNKK